MQRIGILGGTFDPIHHAHLAIAEEARVALGLERVLFVVAAQQPFKDRHFTSPPDRLAMVAAATASNQFFAPSSIELDRPGPSYTVDTLETLSEQYPGADFWFILGADALRWLPRWHNIGRLSELTRFAALERPGAVLDPAALEADHPGLGARIDRLAGPSLDLSSTEIRNRIAAGLPIRYLVPDGVDEYIARNTLYRTVSGGATL
ncbi:MAG TPA: nicotinate-nucleotide adenylyltransferase [Herpetosiphonaceae bacterium]|nr:nicotinate-nucleotide adenylyltransferase [Herpetosiphonaceae bacterium]